MGEPLINLNIFKKNEKVGPEHAVRLYKQMEETAKRAKEQGVFMVGSLHTGYQLRQATDGSLMSIAKCNPDSSYPHPSALPGLTLPEIQRGVISMNIDALVKPLPDNPNMSLTDKILISTGLADTKQRRIVIIDENKQVVMLDRPKAGGSYTNRAVGLVSRDIALIRSVNNATASAIAIYEQYGGYDGWVAAVEKGLGGKPEMVGITRPDDHHYRLYGDGLDPLFSQLHEMDWQHPKDSLKTEAMSRYTHGVNKETSPGLMASFEAEDKKRKVADVKLFNDVLNLVREQPDAPQIKAGNPKIQ